MDGFIQSHTYSNATHVLLFVAATGAVMIPFKVYSDVMPEKIIVANNGVSTLRTDQAIPISMISLDSEGYSLVQPIAITLQESDGEYVASFPEAEIITSGDTPTEAVKWLKESIVSTFDLLRAKRGVLGPLPKRQLQALEKYVAKKQIRTA
jgi:predicted RNase H-like HicB family nuclease